MPSWVKDDDIGNDLMTTALKPTRQHLANLAGLAAKTESDERKILKNATERLKQVQSEIEKSLPGIAGASEEKQYQYLDLVNERGQLQIVIAKANERLNKIHR